jgi:hypothetical protein
VGHIFEIRFSSEAQASKTIDEILRSAPYFYRFNEGYSIYEYLGPAGDSREPFTPDCAITVEAFGLLFNALGDRSICGQIEDHLMAALKREYGNIEVLY